MKYIYKHIAIIRLSALGDIINTTIVLQFIHQIYPDLKIDWICEEVFAPLLDTHPLINKVYTVNLKKLRKEKSFKFLKQTILNLRKLPKYDMIIDMHGLLKSAIVAKLTNNKIYGYDKHNAKESLASLFYTKKSHIAYESNIIKRNINLINDILALHVSDMMIRDKEPTLPIYDKLLSVQEKYIVLIIGASYKSKIYPKEKIVEVCNALTCKAYIVWGNEQEKEDATFIVKHSKNIQLLDKLSLKELCALISHASLVIGNDTGPTHLAWAYNIPSITLFGSTDDNMIFTTKQNIAICSDSKVNALHVNKNDFSIKQIKPDTIINKAKELLEC